MERQIKPGKICHFDLPITKGTKVNCVTVLCPISSPALSFSRDSAQTVKGVSYSVKPNGVRVVTRN